MKMKKNIEYSQKSWNAFTGCDGIENGTCAVGTKCWAYRMSLRQAGRNGYPDRPNQFKPTFHENRLNEPILRKKPTIFNVSFMGDIAYAEMEWLYQIIKVIGKCPQHRFIFLTKRPDLLADLDGKFPSNCIVGVTVNCQNDTWRIGELMKVDCEYLWASFEPIYSAIHTNLIGLDWCVIGAQTIPDMQPKSEWVDYLMRSADYRGIPVFLKPNLNGYATRMELPDMLKIGDE